MSLSVLRCLHSLSLSLRGTHIYPWHRQERDNLAKHALQIYKGRIVNSSLERTGWKYDTFGHNICRVCSKNHLVTYRVARVRIPTNP